MTTYSDNEFFQWNSINSSSQVLDITLSPEVLRYLAPYSFSGDPDSVLASLYDSVLSYQECDDPTVTPESQFVYDGSTSIQLEANSTLTLYGQYAVQGNSVWSIEGSDRPAILVNGEWALFTYSRNDDADDLKQYVNIEGQNGFMVTLDTKQQNNVTGNGVEIGNGGGGGPLSTDNMCFQISDIGATLLGTAGDDDIDGSGLNNVIAAYKGSDKIHGLGGIDYIVAGSDADRLYGGTDDDILIGRRGQDLLEGGAGDDFLDGGWGCDELLGGLGADAFFLSTKSGSINVDTIIDFSAEQRDQVAISRQALGISPETGLSLLVTNRRLSLDSALASNRLFVFNASTGGFFYNANGIQQGTVPAGGKLAVFENIASIDTALGLEIFKLI